MKKLAKILVTALVLIFLTTPVIVNAETPYKTYTVDGYGYVMETQTAYTPYSAITKVGDTSFITPVDMSLSKSGNLYIADSGAKAILVCNLAGEEVRRIGDGILAAPTGVYVTEDETIYVADKDAGKVFVFNKDGEVIHEYGKPSSPIYGDAMPFKPIKIVANSSGTMYIICEGNMNGIVQLSPVEGGSFLGYFGTNYTSLNPFEILQRMILTDAQRAKLLSNIPSTPTNLAIDDDGLIYTVTQGDDSLSLKKLNIAGNNMLTSDPYYADLPAAVTTGKYNNILVADSDGYIYEYNEEGELLFMLGGRDDGRQRIGLCNKVEAIAVDDNDRVYLLDSDKKQIHVFEPTEFTNLIHESLELYAKGSYTQSKEPLTEVLKMNSLFDYANKAIGRAYYQEENYKEALKYARLSKDFDGYSNAFWEVRNVWIRSNLVKAVGIIILIVILIKIWKMLVKKGKFGNIVSKYEKFKNIKLVDRLRYSKFFMRHPIDGCYAVKREGKNSVLCATIILVLFIIISIIGKYYPGFLLKTVREGRYDLVTDIGKVLVIFFGLIACNYLVVTINDGEGSIKELYCAYAYCLSPYVFIKPICILVGNVLTYNEVFIIQFGNLCITVWVVVLLFLTLKEINNYSVKETIKAIFITAFTVLIMALLISILYVLCSQVIDFVITVVREVVYRIGN